MYKKCKSNPFSGDTECTTTLSSPYPSSVDLWPQPFIWLSTTCTSRASLSEYVCVCVCVEGGGEGGGGVKIELSHLAGNQGT